MKHFLTIIIFSFFCISTYSQEWMYNGEEIEEGRIIIKLQPSLKSKNTIEEQSILNNILSDYNAKKTFPAIATGPLSHFFEIYCYDTNEFKKILNKLNTHGAVEYAEPNYITKPFYVPSDPKIGSQYYLQTIKAFEAWDISKSDSTVLVAVTDDGFDFGHTELVNKIAYNYNDIINGIDDDNDGYVDNFRGWDLGEDDNSAHSTTLIHGTQVAGLICAQPDNAVGIAGVGYNVRILPVKLTNASGQFTRSYESIVYAVNAGADIINCSWGGTVKHSFGRDVIDYAQSNGAIIVAASGNANSMTPYYPASYNGVISVAATTINDEKWSPLNTSTLGGSTYNEYVDICAPGTNIVTSTSGNTYTTIAGGTSAACPIVSGALALMKSHFPLYSNKQLIEQLLNSSDIVDTSAFNMPYQEMLGNGRLNCYNALNESYSGVVLEDISFIGNNGSDFYSGDTIVIRGRISNYLEKGYAISATLSTRSNHLKPLQNYIIIDSIDTKHIGEVQDLFSFVILENTPFNFSHILLFSVKQNGRTKRQYIDFYCNPTATAFVYNTISTWVNSNGSFGKKNNNFYALNYNKNNLLTEAGLILKNEFDNVVSCIGEENNFSASSLPIKHETDTTISITASYKDIKGLNYSIENKIWVHKGYSYNHLFFDYIFKNNTDVQKMNNYAGIYFDWDIAHNYSNFIEYDSTRKLEIIQSTIVGSPVVGLLGLRNCNGFYALDSYSEIDNRGNFLAKDQGICISENHYETNKQIFGDDVALTIWRGPFTLEKHSTDTMSFVVLFAPSIDSLKNIADVFLKSDTGEVVSSTKRIGNAINFFDIVFEDSELHVFTHLQKGTASLYSSTGLCLSTKQIKNGHLFFETENLSDGIYHILLQSNSEYLSRSIYVK